jgi:RNA polymerase sigma-70 factor (ECF subfamily)
LIGGKTFHVREASYTLEVSNVNSSANFEYLQYISGTVDRKAVVSELMSAYGNDVWNFALTLSGSSEQADAIAQEAFVRAYRGLQLYRGEASVKVWLLSLTRSSAAAGAGTSLLRKMKGAGRADDRSEMNPSWRKVIALPLKYREALILSAHHRLTLAEIAYVLDVSEETAKTRLHQARLRAIEAKGG